MSVVIDPAAARKQVLESAPAHQFVDRYTQPRCKGAIGAQNLAIGCSEEHATGRVLEEIRFQRPVWGQA